MSSEGTRKFERAPRPEVKFAPRDIFEKILEYSVIPTFDLVIEMPGGAGVVIARRIIAPYENQWALPGLRMFKPEGLEDVINRIAEDELGLKVDAVNRRFIGQFVGRFKSEHERQDVSTGYIVSSSSDIIRLNEQHFSGYRIIKSIDELPKNTGAMYRFYLSRYFSSANEPPPGF